MDSKRLSYIIVWLIFIVLLILADNIIACFIDDNVTKVKYNIEDLIKDNVYFSVDSIHFRNNIFGTFDLQGWVFCETEDDNSAKEVWIILSNDKNTYKRKVVLRKRDDVVEAYKEKYNIRGTFHGFSSSMSTVGVTNGIYKLNIYCSENSKNYGLADTGIMIEKFGKKISQYIINSSKVDNLSPVIDNNVIYAVDYISIIDSRKTLCIKGWAFVEGMDTIDQKIYVCLTYEDGSSDIYDTQTFLRPDVGKVYNDDIYNNSGFKANIPVEELTDGEIDIDILIDNQNNIYSSAKPIKFTLSEGTVQTDLNCREIETKENMEQDLANSVISISPNVKYTIDSCSVNGSLSVNGWGFIEGIEAQNTTVYLEIKSANGELNVFSTNKVSRPDVAKHFNNELYTESGFNANIPLDAIAEGENIITVIVDNKEMLKAEKPFVFNYTMED